MTTVSISSTSVVAICAVIGVWIVCRALYRIFRP